MIYLFLISLQQDVISLHDLCNAIKVAKLIAALVFLGKNAVNIYSVNQQKSQEKQMSVKNV